MSLELNGKKFTRTDPKTLSDAFDELQKLPKLPISHETKNNPKKAGAVTIVQRETLFIVDGDEPSVKALATIDSLQCVFLVCRGKTQDKKIAHFAAHVDASNKYNWAERLISMKGDAIEVYLVGGEDGSPESEKILQNILKYLIELSNKENLNIVFRGQRILADFRQTKAELPEQCRQYIFQKAAIVWEQQFKKPFPEEFYTMDFGIEDPLHYRSTIPTLPTLDDVLDAMPKRIPTGKEEKKDLAAHQVAAMALVPFIQYLRAPTGLDLFSFCGFLLNAGAYEESRKALFEATSKEFAKDEATLTKNLKQLFSALGYDTLRLCTSINGNQRITMHTQFCFNLDDCSVSPVSNLFSKIPFYYQRRGQVITMLEDTQYVEVYAAGAYKKPVSSKLFIARCDRHAQKFKDPDVVLSVDEENYICKQFGVPTSSICKRDLWSLLSYYANHRDEFVTPAVAEAPQAKAPQKKASPGPASGIKGGFFNTPPKKAPVSEKVAQPDAVPAKAPEGIKKGFFTSQPKKDPVSEKVAQPNAVPAKVPAKAKAGSELAGGFLKPAVKK